MSAKITHDQKETAIAALREHGTMQYASKISGVAVRTLNLEMTRSLVFKRRVLEAREEGKRNIADKAIELIKRYAYGEMDEICPACKGVIRLKDSCKVCEGKGSVLSKTDRNRLTAAIALANAYEPGFRGVTTIQGQVDHNVRVITAVPRPKYIEFTEGKLREITEGRSTKGNEGG